MSDYPFSPLDDPGFLEAFQFQVKHLIEVAKTLAASASMSHARARVLSNQWYPGLKNLHDLLRQVVESTRNAPKVSIVAHRVSDDVLRSGGAYAAFALACDTMDAIGDHAESTSGRNAVPLSTLLRIDELLTQSKRVDSGPPNGPSIDPAALARTLALLTPASRYVVKQLANDDDHSMTTSELIKAKPGFKGRIFPQMTRTMSQTCRRASEALASNPNHIHVVVDRNKITLITSDNSKM
jgi:hypothetical protein